MWVTQSEARHIMGDLLVLRVGPHTVDSHVGLYEPLTKGVLGGAWKYVPKRIRRTHPFAIPTRLFPAVRPIEDVKDYRWVQEMASMRPDFRRTAWYASMIADLTATGSASYKRRRFHRVEDVDLFFEQYILAMIDSIGEAGWRSDIDPTVGTAMISEY